MWSCWHFLLEILKSVAASKIGRFSKFQRPCYHHLPPLLDVISINNCPARGGKLRKYGIYFRRSYRWTKKQLITASCISNAAGAEQSTLCLYMTKFFFDKMKLTIKEKREKKRGLLKFCINFEVMWQAKVFVTLSNYGRLRSLMSWSNAGYERSSKFIFLAQSVSGLCERYDKYLYVGLILE